MKKQTAANISIVLALMLLPTALIIFSVMLNEHEPNTTGVMLIRIATSLTLLILLTASWLAGYSYAEARKRSIFSTLCCVVYVSACVWLFWT